MLVLLGVGGLFMALSNGRFLLAPAAWLFPVIFLFAIRDMGWRIALVSLTLVMAIGNQLSFHKMLPSLPIPLFEYVPALAGAMYAIPFVLQKVVYQRTHSFVATLFLPCVYTLLDYLNVYVNPFGTFGVLGYSQHEFLAVAQVASVVGVTGITFLIIWTASIVYWLSLSAPGVSKRKVALVTGAALMLLVTWGGIRVNHTIEEDTVLVSGLHTIDRTDGEVLEIFSLHSKEEESFLQKAEERMEQVINQTEAEARTGANIIHHAEGVVVIDEAQKEAYLQRLGEVAERWGVYIVTVPYIFTEKENPNENVLYIIDSDGEVALEHYKYGGNIVEKTVEGEKTIPFVDTEYGRMAGIICWDKDFPTVVDQIGEQDVDLLFIPSADWKEISPYHTIVGNFRGIENGANVITQTVNGMSMIADYKGQTLVKMDHFTTDHWVMRGHVSTSGIATAYSSWGKYFIGCIIMTLMLSFLFIYRSKKRRRIS
ncbi:nitrilase-related carbon-nitrogen hydrolase [Pontibacillus salicampi]|uniref:Nitrilase-related carbon-nitrogen hydrolase n=2 Tax=Pontibacillus salicampi TaxID=1449801 RepID=A0ABV6LMK2_9BACI